MGIDPNNHRLNQTPPRLESSNNISVSATSSGLKTHLSPQKKSCGGDKDQVSDAGSCLEDEPSRLPDLNLDLTISIPSPLPAKIEKVRNPSSYKNDMSRDSEIAPSSTLVLFR